jgi:hypothetical protein
VVKAANTKDTSARDQPKSAQMATRKTEKAFQITKARARVTNKTETTIQP